MEIGGIYEVQIIMIEDVMRKDVGKEFFWEGKLIKIVNSFSCYEGDFYEYTVNGKEEIYRINIGVEKGYSFTRSIPK